LAISGITKSKSAEIIIRPDFKKKIRDFAIQTFEGKRLKMQCYRFGTGRARQREDKLFGLGVWLLSSAKSVGDRQAALALPLSN